MSFYLRAKHWQIFILLVGGMMLAQTMPFASVGQGVVSNTIEFVIPIAIFLMLYLGWLWAVADASVKALPSDLTVSSRFFKVAHVYAFLHFILSGLIFFGPGKEPNGLFIMLHFLAMVVMLYSLGFTAKQLTKLDQGKDVTFFSYSGPLFLLWFFPVGICFVQPKVNQLLGQKIQ